jgi:hypothetical protein
MPRTIDEVTTALASVRTAITAAETAQDYTTAIGQRKAMANLSILYAREERLLKERDALTAGGVGSGPVVNAGIIAR